MSKIFRKTNIPTNIPYFLMNKRTCVTNVSFSENFAYVPNE